MKYVWRESEKWKLLVLKDAEKLFSIVMEEELPRYESLLEMLEGLR